MRRSLVIPLLAAVLAAAATAGAGVASDQRPAHRGGDADTYSVGLWADVPYSDVQKTTGVPNLVADMNQSRLAFSVHAGDLKSGGSTCDDSVYYDFKASLNTLRAPAVFTPGDNDWTDCDRPAAGSYNSAERLAFERKVFFDTPFALGQRKLRQQVQEKPYVENRRWTRDGVTYATLNVQGSCDNLCDVAPDPAEHAARTTANITWLKAAFAEAYRQRSAAVMIVWQANPGFDRSDPTRAPLRDPRTLAQTDSQPDGFQDLLLVLREQTVAYKRPVALVHGDSHYFRIDKPLLDSQGRRVENFTRVETFGDNAQNGNNDVNWVKVDVDPDSREVFSFQPQIVPGNRTAVPAG